MACFRAVRNSSFRAVLSDFQTPPLDIAIA